MVVVVNKKTPDTITNNPEQTRKHSNEEQVQGFSCKFC